jgi:predicted HicB family RNase H-like nuclease
MRIKVELSDQLSSKLKRTAEKEGIAVNTLIVQSIRAPSRRQKYP